MSHTHTEIEIYTHTHICILYGRSRYIKQSFQKRGDYLIVCLMISKGMKQIILKVCFLLCIVFVFLYYVCVSGVSKRETAERPVRVEAAKMEIYTHTHIYIVNSMYGRSRYIKQSFQKRGDY